MCKIHHFQTKINIYINTSLNTKSNESISLKYVFLFLNSILLSSSTNLSKSSKYVN